MIIDTVRITLEEHLPNWPQILWIRALFSSEGGLLKNLDVLLREVTACPSPIVDDPLSAIVLGAGKVLDNNELLHTVTANTKD